MTWPERAIVVIHGIGEQRRGNTVDAFVRALGYCGAGTPRVIREKRSFGEKLPQDAIRVKRGDVQADVYEIYWASHTARKTKAASVLAWMYRATFIPAGKLKKPSRKTLWDVTAALLASVLIVFALLFGVTSLGNLSAQVACRTDTEVVCELPAEQRNITGPGVTWELDQVLAIGRALTASLEIGDRPLRDVTPEHAAEVLTLIPLRYWALLMAIGFVVTQAMFRARQVIVGIFQGEPRWRENRVGWQISMLLALVATLFVLVHTIAPVMTAFLLIVVVVGSFIRGATHFLAESLGDVQVYSERDENSEYHEARQAVLDEAEKTFALLAQRNYQHIYIVGHSLGSVIAFTALDRLRWRIPPLMGKIKGFITIGTALEKVRYFFERRKDADEEASARLVEAAVDIAEDRIWLNLWYSNDLVANPITTFDTPNKQHISYQFEDKPALPQLLQQATQRLVVNLECGYVVAPFPLIWTHSRYWGDRKVMQLITDIALPVTAPAAQ